MSTHRQPRGLSVSLYSQATGRRTQQRTQLSSQQQTIRCPAHPATRLRSDVPGAARSSGGLDQPKRQGGRGADRPETDETPGAVSSPAEVAIATIAATDTAQIAALHRTNDHRQVRCEAGSARPPLAAVEAALSVLRSRQVFHGRRSRKEGRRPQARDEPTGPRLTTQQHPADDRTNQHSTLRSTTSHHTHGIPLLQTACGRNPFRRFGLRNESGVG